MFIDTQLKSNNCAIGFSYNEIGWLYYYLSSMYPQSACSVQVFVCVCANIIFIVIFVLRKSAPPVFLAHLACDIHIEYVLYTVLKLKFGFPSDSPLSLVAISVCVNRFLFSLKWLDYIFGYPCLRKPIFAHFSYRLFCYKILQQNDSHNLYWG